MQVESIGAVIPPEVRIRQRIPGKTVLLVASFGAFLAFLDATIVNVAFPNIRESFPDSTISSLSWILNAYSIIFAAFLVVSGRLADLLGRRRAFTNGVLLFTVASVLCAFAPSSRSLSPSASSRRSVRRCWCRRRWRWSSRRSPRSGARTPSACGVRRPRSPQASARRSAARWSSGATGAGPSWSTCRSASRRCGPVAGSWSRAGLLVVAACPTCSGRPCRHSCSAPSPWASSRARTGDGPARP